MLRIADFLDAAEHPLVELRADGVPLSGPPSEVKASGTIRGVTRELTLQTAVEPDGDALRLRATGDLDRRDFGVVPRSRVRDRVLTGSRIGVELEVLLVPDGGAR